MKAVTAEAKVKMTGIDDVMGSLQTKAKFAESFNFSYATSQLALAFLKKF